MTLDHALSLRSQGKHEEARQIMLRMATASPTDAELHYQTACVHDSLGLEVQAVPFYVAALAGNLSESSRRGAYLGLGSTYRTLGKYEESAAVFTEGLTTFPEANEIKVFYAMTCHNLGRSKEAIEALLTLVARTSQDMEIRRYARAIEFYAQNIDQAWRE